MMRKYARRAWDWWTDANARFGSLFVAILFTIATGTLIAIFIQIQTNAAQDRAFRADQRERVAAQDQLMSCFDRSYTGLLGSLPAVREATQERDNARDEYDKTLIAALTGDRGIGGLLLRAQAGKPNDPKDDLNMLVKTFGLVKAKADALDRASAHLEMVRLANPYPEPPSKFCDLP